MTHSEDRKAQHEKEVAEDAQELKDEKEKLDSVFTFSYTVGAEQTSHSANVLARTASDAGVILKAHLKAYGADVTVSSGTVVAEDVITSATPVPAAATKPAPPKTVPPANKPPFKSGV